MVVRESNITIKIQVNLNIYRSFMKPMNLIGHKYGRLTPIKLVIRTPEDRLL